MCMGKARIASLARQFSQLRSSCQLLGQQQPNWTISRVQQNVQQQQRSYMQRPGGELLGQEQPNWTISRVQQNVQQQQRFYMQRPGGGAARVVTLIPEDGIGPLVTRAVVQFLEAKDAPVHFETNEISGKMVKMPEEDFGSVRKYELCLKGGPATAVGGALSYLNDPLRKELHLSASFVHCSNLPELQERHDEVDIVVNVEYTEGKYSGLEHEVVHGVVEALLRKYCKLSVQVRSPTSTTGKQ